MIGGVAMVISGNGRIVTFNVVTVAHCPAKGVNVYVEVPAVAVFIVAGDQVPVIPLFEVVGKVGATLPTHTAIGLNVGIVGFGAV